ncbi:hypothetical protein ACUH9Y_06435 [Dermabacteraceae bacterium P13115]
MRGVDTKARSGKKKAARADSGWGRVERILNAMPKWLLLVIALAILVVPTAIVYSLVDLVLDGPSAGIKAFFATSVCLLIYLAVSFAWDMWKDSKRPRGKKKPKQKLPQ